MTLNLKEYQRFEKQIILKKVGISGQKKINKAKVLIIGVGGLGCPLLSYLASSGVNNIGIVNELRKKRVIRGKKLKLRVICPQNKRYVPSKKQCVRVSGQQKMLKKRAMRKAAIKKRGKKAMILRKRIKSLRKRKAMGLRRGR